jgi:hypothetical protein
MHRLLGLASAPSTLLTPSGASSNRGWGADVHAAPIPRLQIGPGRNPGSCIRDPLPLTDDGRRNFCLAYHYAGRCNLNCGGKATHQPLSWGGSNAYMPGRSNGWTHPSHKRPLLPHHQLGRPRGLHRLQRPARLPGLPQIAHPRPAENAPRPLPGGARLIRI